jgi:hypothetical protein
MRVICEAGYSGCDYPKAFSLHDRDLTVERVLKEWREPNSKHFLVAADNGGQFELIFSETEYAWKISGVSGLPNY